MSLAFCSLIRWYYFSYDSVPITPNTQSKYQNICYSENAPGAQFQVRSLSFIRSEVLIRESIAFKSFFAVSLVFDAVTRKSIQPEEKEEK